MIGMSSSSASATIMIGVSGWKPKTTLVSTTTNMIAMVMAMR